VIDVSSADDLTAKIEAVRVVVVTVATNATTQAVVHELRRESMSVESSASRPRGGRISRPGSLRGPLRPSRVPG
jgi:hypothetical protein